MPANQGISVNPAYTYAVVEAAGGKYVVAKDLLEKVAEELEWENPKVLEEVSGKDLEYMTAQHPFYDRESLVILGDHVTLDAGT